jgi:hypothetical protein
VRRLLSTLMLAAAAGTVVPAAAAVAATSPAARPALQRFGVRLVDVPVSEAHNPRALRYIIDYLPPGAVIHRRIRVVNQESRTAHFTVYPDAAQISHGYFIGDAGHTRSELTTWITIQHPSLTLRPHTGVMDMVTIRVPRKPTKGGHYGVIWAQQTSLLRMATGFAVKEVNRVGIRMYLDIGPGGVAPTNFTITSITGHRSPRGRPYLTALVHNTGGLAVDLNGTVRLTGGPGSTSAGPFSAQQVTTLAPGQSWTMTFAPASRIPNGPWTATITLVSGLTTRTATATIQFSGSPVNTGWTTRLPIMTGAAAIIALLALAGFRLRRTPQRRHAHAWRRTADESS